MIKGSPKIQIKSPRNTIEAINYQINKLPKIRERLLTHHGKRTETNNEESEDSKKPKRDVIKFFDMPSPINEKKIDIVRELLAKRKTNTLKLKEAVSDDPSTPSHELATCRSELDLQIQFLKEKSSPRSPNKLIVSDKSVQDLNISQSDSFFISPSYRKPDCKNVLAQSIEASHQSSKIIEKKRPSLEQELEKQVKENAYLKAYIDQLTSDILKLKEEKQSYHDYLNQSSEHNNLLKETLKKNRKLLEDIELKISDIDMLKEQIKRNDQQKKTLTEAAKEIESYLDTEKNKNSQLSKIIETLQTECLALKESLIKEREINSQLKLLENDFNQLQGSLNTLSQENKDLKSQNLSISESLKSAQNSLNNSKFNSREKETKYEKMIENLMDQLQLEKARNNKQLAETIKLKRALTFRETESSKASQKEETIKPQVQESEGEKEKQELIEEIEKLKRNITYYSFIIKNKDEIIHVLEEENKRMNLTVQNSSFVFSLDTLNVLKDFVKSWMVCHKCSQGIAMYLIIPCRHLVCSKCEPLAHECPKCCKDLTEIRLYSEFNKVREISMVLYRINIT